MLKADGLAAGKGVVVCTTEDEVAAGIAELDGLAGPLVVEELLEGPEISIFALCDGTSALALAAAQDFKRAEDGDRGPNTGGMGSFAPVPGYGDEEIEELVELACRPVLAELAARGRPFIGALFAGLMLTAEGPRVLEYNCRFGDPETQSLLPLVDGDLLAALAACAAGDLGGVRLGRSDGAAVTVVLAAGNYPAGGDRGSPIEGIEAAEATGALVFQAGTALRDGAVVTNGGRILNVTGVGDDLAEARQPPTRSRSDHLGGRPPSRGRRPRREPVGPHPRSGHVSTSARRLRDRAARRLVGPPPGRALEWPCDRSLLPPGHEPDLVGR